MITKVDFSIAPSDKVGIDEGYNYSRTAAKR